MNIRRHPIFYTSLGFIAGLVITAGSFAVADNSTNTSTSTAAPAQDNSLPLTEVQRFSNALHEIKSYYVKPVSDVELFESAIRGMVDSLDPHSNYLNAVDYKNLTSTTTGEFGGLGLEVTQFQGVIKVITPIDSTPAAKAGVKPGDLIISLDGTPTDGMSLKDAVDKMRGEIGSTVTLVVIRKGEKDPLTFNIIRDEIHVKSVIAKMLDPGYGYIRLSEFQENSPDEISTAIQSLQTQAGGQLEGLILDLRNNPGGLLNSSVSIADMFLDSDKLGNNKLIVYTKGRVPEAQLSENATPGDLLNGTPIVVLINGGSASAAEIVAGALKDHNRAVLVGARSFGKGSVQTVLPLDDTTGIKITTALYFTPDGHSIQALGIQPDIQVDANLTVSKPKGNNAFDYSEANLTGHLQNGQGIPSSTVNNNTAHNDAMLAHEDYTLYEGLNILKTMSVLDSEQKE